MMSRRADGVGALHGFDGDAGGFDDHRLADVVLRQKCRATARRIDVLAFLVAGSALGQDRHGPAAARGTSRVKQRDALSAETSTAPMRNRCAW
jgi:hypothetical protein